MAEEDTKLPSIDRRVSEDFISFYANNVMFESSVWDLKMIFGQLDQSESGNPIINIEGSLALPWLQAKIMSFFLQLQLAAYEHDRGTIQVPSNVLPASPDAVDTNPAFDDNIKALYRRLYSQVFAP